jgi:hypothetical protein
LAEHLSPKDAGQHQATSYWASGSADYPIDSDNGDRRWMPLDFAEAELRLLSQMAIRQQPLHLDIESCELSPTGRYDPRVIVCQPGLGKSWVLKMENQLRGRRAGPIVIDEGHFSVEGEMTAYFENDALLQQMLNPRPITDWLEYPFGWGSPEPIEVAPAVPGKREARGVHRGPRRGDDHNHNLPDAALAAEVPNRKQRRALQARRRKF